MLPIERKNEILSRLMIDGKVVVSDLSARFGVTEETIRRDLDKLEQEGLAKKTYGGAVKTENLSIELPYTIRQKTNVDAKKQIAELIATRIEDGDSILLDASTTALYTVKSIYNKENITILTNSVQILLDAPPKATWSILSTGGILNGENLYFSGRQVEEISDRYRMKYAILSCKGIDMESGLTDASIRSADIKRAFLRGASKVILAVDATKFGRTALTKIADFSHIDTVVTDVEPSPAWKQFFRDKDIELIYPS
jgi:DeoR/GlpR family transcriptional regulator of sugar metabolism